MDLYPVPSETVFTFLSFFELNKCVEAEDDVVYCNAAVASSTNSTRDVRWERCRVHAGGIE